MSPLHAFIAFLTLAVVTAAPVTYDQRQDGEFNVRADVQNVVLLAIIPDKTLSPSQLLGFFKNAEKRSDKKSQMLDDIEDRADTVMEAFVEPGTPYRVEIMGKSSLSDVQAEVDSPIPVLIPVENDRYVIDAERDAKVVEIAGKRREDNKIPEDKVEVSPEEPLKLLGAMEQCGPERVRDQDGICQWEKHAESDLEKAALPSSGLE